MFDIDYNLLLDDKFVYGLTSNVLKTQNTNKILEKGPYGYIIIENNNINSILNDHFVMKILNSIHLYTMTKEDPYIIFKLKDLGKLNDNNYDSNLYNTICISILSNENKILKEQLNDYINPSPNKKRKLGC